MRIRAGKTVKALDGLFFLIFFRSFTMPNWLKRLGAKARYIAPIMAMMWYAGLYAHEIWNAVHSMWA